MPWLKGRASTGPSRINPMNASPTPMPTIAALRPLAPVTTSTMPPTVATKPAMNRSRD